MYPQVAERIKEDSESFEAQLQLSPYRREKKYRKIEGVTLGDDVPALRK